MKDLVNPRHRKCVYTIPWSCGKFYIGEIGRSVKIWLKEYATNIMKDKADKSSLIKHCHNSDHHICIENAKLIMKEEHYLKRKVKEVVKIEK